MEGEGPTLMFVNKHFTYLTCALLKKQKSLAYNFHMKTKKSAHLQILISKL